MAIFVYVNAHNVNVYGRYVKSSRSANLKSRIANARVVNLPRAGHYLFLTREADVLSEMHRFVMTLK